MPIPFSGCIIWLGADNGRGYGVVTINGRQTYAHRASYEYSVGPIPDGMFVCHHCDVRSCINPRHLFLGTARANTSDMISKGRAKSPGAPGDRNASRKYPELVRGESNGRAVLSRADVEAIRAAHTSGNPQRKLAKQYGVGQSQIGRICRGEHWK